MATSAPTTLTVNTRRGSYTFETRLEWHEAVEELRILAEGGNDFAQSLYKREVANKYLSTSQVSWVYKLAQEAVDERAMDIKVLKLEPQAKVDASNILASLAEARAKGIKKPLLRLAMSEGAEIRLKYMSSGRNAGGAWVTYSGDLVGQINDSGVFTWRGNASTSHLEQEVTDTIKQANSDPMAALQAYGKITKRCGCCGIELTNSKSIELGIGPICLSKYGLLAMA